MFSRTPNALRCSVTTVLLSAFLFASGNAAALGLGDLVVRSRLGQTLRAEIRLLEAPGQGNLGETCFRLGEAAGGENLPVLTQGRLRLEQGKRLLGSGLPVSEVALAVGFFDQSHFHHGFRQAFGLTPAEYRQQMLPA